MTAHIFTIAKIQKPADWPLADDGMKNMLYLEIKYYAILSLEGDFGLNNSYKNILLSEITTHRKDKYCESTYILYLTDKLVESE